jgi:hypothetical protein
VRHERTVGWGLLVLGWMLLCCCAPRSAQAADASEETLPTEFGVRWEEPQSTADAIAAWLGATLKPDDGYRVEFWQPDHDAAGNTSFFRLRTVPTVPISIQVIRKVRTAAACTYACAADEGAELREVDETLVIDAAGSGFVGHRLCSTSCARQLPTRPEQVTTSPPCAGGPAEVQRWKVQRDGKRLRLERWARGEHVLWELSGRSEDVPSADFRAIAAPLLAHGVQPLARSKRDWMCEPA